MNAHVNPPGGAMMGYVRDTLVNWLSGLGTPKDKRAHHHWAITPISQGELNMAYRGDWIARKGIDIPAKDMTRAWRSWQAEPDDITTIEKAERDLKLQLRTRQALQKARLFGGGAIIIGLDDSAGPQDTPLELDRVKAGSLKFLHAVSRWELNAGDLQDDIAITGFQEPKYYYRQMPDGNQVKIDASRVVRFIGNEVLDSTQRDIQGWGDSVLQSVNDAVLAASSTIANVAGMVEEAKIDIIRMPELMKNFSTQDYETRLTRRFSYVNSAQSIINARLMDKDEEWERHQMVWAGLPDIVKLYLMITSGALDIPATRFLSQSPAGMNATGDSDTRNYYDMLASEQSTVVQPAMSNLDEVIIRSALGSRDEAIFYLWNPLWQMDDVQKATMAKTYTDIFVQDVNTGLINEDALREARINQLIEQGVYPGLEQAIDEFGDEPSIDENPIDPATGLPVDPKKPPTQNGVPAPAANENNLFKQQAKRVGDALIKHRGVRRLRVTAPRGYRDRKRALEKQRLKDAQPRTLYMRRDVLNGEEIIAHFKAQGLKNLHDPSDLHVTIAYSREPVDWLKIGSDDWGGDKDGKLVVKPGGPRLIEQLGGEKVVTLVFMNNDLLYRHMRTCEAGCAWDYAEYQPHITVAEAPANASDLRTMEPYQGAIELGPEIFQEIDDNWSAVMAADGYSQEIASE
jgi:phage-related protein (TIGR01555 family)